ncbi:hypothetical protein FACS189414_1910 [Bacteroidia bacterium]|nr:hypothetical protein FACS189414_1910 [Bacteroidia bacterium]
MGIYGEVEDYRVYIQRITLQLEDQYATVQNYFTVETVPLNGAIIPDAIRNNPSFSLKDSIVPGNGPKAGILTYSGSGVNTRVTYQHTGAATSCIIDSFKYAIRFYDNVASKMLYDTTTVYIFILQPQTGQFAACYGTSVSIELMKPPSPAVCLFSWYNDPAGLSANGTNPRDITTATGVTADLTYYVRPDVPGYDFPLAKLIVPVYGSSFGDNANMRWTGLFDNEWYNPHNWVEVKTDALGNVYETPVNGAPTSCVDVVIPSNCVNYPELTKWPEKSVLCGDIVMKDRAMIKKTEALVYDSARVEIKLKPAERDRFVMWSAPLRSMYSGDYHYTNNTNGQPQWSDVYMNLFQQANPSGAGSAAANTYTATFGETDFPLDLGQPFNLKVKTTSESKDKLFIFPQKHTTYPGATTSLIRYKAGKFITDSVSATFDMKLVANDNMNLVQVVNPYMAYLKFSDFYAANSTVISNGFYVWNGDTNNDFDAVTTLGNRFIYKNANIPTVSTTEPMVPPLQSFIVAKRNSGTAPVLTLKMSSNYTTTSSTGAYTLRSTTLKGGILRIKASQGNKTSFTLLAYEPQASPARDDGDMPVVVFDEIPLTVYSLTALNEPLAINVSNDFQSQEVPLGLRIKEAGLTKLEFTELNTFGYDVTLIDKQLNKLVPLKEGDTYTFAVSKPSGAGAAFDILDRISLEMKYTGSVGTESISTEVLDVHVSSEYGRILVKSNKGLISNLQIYSIPGTLVYSSNTLSDQFSIPVSGSQTYIVKIQFANNENRVEKVFVK